MMVRPSTSLGRKQLILDFMDGINNRGGQGAIVGYALWEEYIDG